MDRLLAWIAHHDLGGFAKDAAGLVFLAIWTGALIFLAAGFS